MDTARRPIRKRRLRKGAALVEFALTVPILFLVVFAAIEFSRVNTIRHSVANAAYEGARRGIVPGATAADARSAASSILTAVCVRDAEVTVSPSVIDADTSEITVSITVPLDQNGWITPKFFEGDILNSSCTLARERYETVFVP
jgi:Flp pilus assembly protein TadG